MSYPRAPRVDLIEILHGVPVSDPFRPLEHAGDPATRAWVDAENALTRERLDGPLRAALADRLRTLHRYPRASVAAVRGRRIFFTENDGSRNQSILYVQDEGQPARALIDPNALDPDGTTAVTAFEPDDEGRRVVYALSQGGSDLQELFVHDVDRGADLTDHLRWVKFASIAWAGAGFFYARFPEPGTVPPEHERYFCQVWFHRLGESQATDRVVYQRRDAPEVVFDVDVTSDLRHLVIVSRHGASDRAEVHVVDPGGAAAGTASPRPIVTGFAHAWHFVDGAGGRLYFRTDAGAPRGRLVRIDLDRPSDAPPVIVEESDDTLALASVAGGRLLVVWLRNASSRLAIVELTGAVVADVALPDIGTVVGVGARWTDRRATITFTSFTRPPQLFAIDVGTGRLTPLGDATLPIDPSCYVTEQVWFPSRDGTPVSMFLVRRVDTEWPAAVLLSGYGGFNISLTPAFDPSDFLWLDCGGAMAVANLRGGGEYGEAWHEAGMRERKQNVFDDFIAAAEWLIGTGRAAPGRIAIEGGSNGGLLVGAVLTQRPDLVGAAVCRVPVADMLRYHLFTVGRFWIPEYGSADDPRQFPYLHRYSPYHNVQDGVAYPPTLVVTAEGDDRVAPGMAKKFAARLQEAQAASAPILLRVETQAGHGAGKSVDKLINEMADVHAFLFTYVAPSRR